MKKTQFIEWGIIILALIFGYKFLETIFGLIIQLLYQYGDNEIYLFRMLIGVAIYGAIFFVLIRNSHAVAEWLNASSAPTDPVPFRIGIRPLLQVILITICAGTILSNISDIILYLYDLVKQDISRRGLRNDTYDSPSKYIFQSALVKSLIAVLIICFSKDIAGWFIRRNEPEELVLESTIENVQDVHK